MKPSATGLLAGFLLFAGCLLVGCEPRTSADATRGNGRDGSAARAKRADSGAGTSSRRAHDERRREAPLCAFRNVHFVVDEDLVLEVRHLVGQFEPTGSKPATFDDPTTFAIRIADAEVALDMRSLAAMMNRYVFPGENAPLRDLEIATDGTRLRIKGKIRKGVVVPFTLVGEVSATPQGEVEIVPAELHAAGVPVRGLLDFFGVELDDLIKENKAVGIRIEENAMFLEPRAILPPPQLVGRIVAVSVEGDRLIQSFGGERDARAIEPRGAERGNTMTFRGGVLRFGRLTMEPTDLTLVDADPADPFLFSLGDYEKHLVAGYSRTLADGSLVTVMPDYDQAGRGLSTPTE
jgi:hypothetical protein